MEFTALPITSYFHFAGALLIIFLAMAGWGWITARLLRLAQQLDVGMLSALGMAVSAVLGGVFSFMGVVGPIMTNLYLAAGIGAMALMLISRRSRLSLGMVNLAIHLKKNPLVLLPGILAIGLLLITILQSGLSLFNTHDDFHAYLVFPSKMIQTGSLGVDPFNERRMMVLGGHSFLQALVLGVLNLRYLNILEMGIGWLVFIALIAGHGIKRNLSAHVWLSLVIILQFIQLPLSNTSSGVTGAALFLALMRAFFLTRQESKIQRVLMLALLTAGLCSLKNSHIVGAGMLVLLVYLLSEKSFRATHIREFLLIIIVTGVFLSPWMLEMMLSSGTFLYPVFGKGYHGSAYGAFPSASAGEISLIWFYHSIRYIALSKSFILGLLLTVFIVWNKGLMPFQRNEVFTVDWPGGASPPPGLPLMQGVEKIAAYLLTKSIRYVIYSYADEAGYPYAEYKDRLTWGVNQPCCSHHAAINSSVR